ncbi:MAG: hypothetical protein IPO61_05640 [Gammaproteobacteria bacterium]|nr:hypothetical protein [Gammaproteobacteria bacterium]
MLVMFLGGCAARQPPALLDVPAFAGDAGTTELPAAEQFLAIDDDMRALVTARLGRVRDPQIGCGFAGCCSIRSSWVSATIPS